MRFGIRHVSVAAVATAVLAAGACGGSGSGSGSAKKLTADQISSLLLTDKDQPGWQFSADSDDKTTTDYPVTLPGAGSACESIDNAENVLSTKYGTTVNVLRTLLDPTGSGSGMLYDDVAVLPSSAKAAAVISDLAAALKGCQSYTDGKGDSSFLVTVNANSPVPSTGHVSFTDYMTGGSHNAMDITDMVQVGDAVVRIAFVGTATHDTAALQQLAATVSRLSEAQISRLKAAES